MPKASTPATLRVRELGSDMYELAFGVGTLLICLGLALIIHASSK